MARKPAFSTLTKTKPTAEPAAPALTRSATAPKPAADRIQTTLRLEPAIWAALIDLAVRKRVSTGQRITVHDLVLEGVHHILALNGAHLSLVGQLKVP